MEYQAQDTLVFEGSYEITPFHQADVNALRRVSARFAGVLVLSTAYLVAVRWVAHRSAFDHMYTAVLGALLLLQVTVHIRHLRNWHLFRTTSAAIQGRVTYPRRVLLLMSAFELLVFAGLFALLGMLLANVFLLGGALACLVLAGNHYVLARRWTALPPKATLTRP